jgi:hypothetical protein
MPKTKLSASKNWGHRNLAPVLVLTCSRWAHFKRLINTLQACPLAEETPLYVALDASFSDLVAPQTERIARFVSTLQGFSGVTLWKQKTNIGRICNYNQAIDKVFELHDRVIFLEDDNIVACNFLHFMNSAMGAFSSDPRCFSVSGYTFQPSKETDLLADFYRAPYFSAWGSGLFRDRYLRGNELLRIYGTKPNKYFLNPLNYLKARKLDPRLFAMYNEGISSGRLYGDVITRLHIMKNNLYSIFPATTKVINKGFDGTGVHCGTIEKPFHEFFEKENQRTFRFAVNPAADDYFKHKNCEWFSRQWPEISRQSLSQYWKYFVRAVGLRDCPPPQI